MYPRLNYLRLFLAWSVLAFHTHIFAFPFSGPIAVWCFFLISGFLVSKILYGRYSGRPKDFLVNRFLRIFPTYWVVLVIGGILIAVNPEEIGTFDFSIGMPDSYGSWVRNLLIFNLSSAPLIVPQAWSLAIEMNWYIMLFIGSFLPQKWLVRFFLANLILPFIIIFVFYGVVYQQGAGFAFSLGALAYHSKVRPQKSLQILSIILLILLMFVAPLYFEYSGLNMKTLSANFSLLASAILLFIALPWLTEEKAVSKLSSLAGDLSYPLFLIHQYVSWTAFHWFNVPRLGWLTLLVRTLFSLLVSLLIVRVVEHPVAILRAKIRTRGAPS